VAIAAALAVYDLGALARRVGWVAPIDDAYIHYQYAWSLAGGHFFRFHPGDAYSTGETSPLYAALLALFPLAGLGRVQLVACSLLLGATILAATLWISALLVARATRARAAAPATLVIVAAHGFLVWIFLSGMETGLYLGLLALLLWSLAAWQLPGDPPATLVAAAALLPLVRPDGVAASVIVCALILSRRREQGGSRAALSRVAWVCAPFGAYLGLNRVLTGEIVTAGIQMKSIPFLPYLDVSAMVARVFDSATTALRELLLGGRADFARRWELPLALMGWIATGLGEARARRAGAGGIGLVLFFYSILAGAQVGVPQWRGERYQAPSFFLLVLGVALAVGHLGALRPRLRPEIAISVALGLWLSPSLRHWRETFVADADVIKAKQVSAAIAVRDRLPRDARVLVCDAGALGFLGERWTYDVVGLTTPMHGNSYVAGPGSRFEELEHLPRARWPDYAAVYFWCTWDGVEGRTLSQHLDLRLQEFQDPGLGTGEDPALHHSGVLTDTLDVADLRSEESHGWREAGGGARERNHVGRGRYASQSGTVADGGRMIVGTVEFTLRGQAGAPSVLVARVAGGAAITADVRLGGGPPHPWAIPAGAPVWLEPEIDLGVLARDGAHVRIDVPPGARLALYHLWLYQTPP
jgi:hypothetical protein